MSYHSKIRRLLQGSALVAGLMLAPLTGTSAWADGVALSGGDAASAGSSDGTMSAVARRAMMRGALPAGQADLDAKAAANAAVDASAARVASRASGPSGGATAGPRTPVIAQGIGGQADAGVSPPDTFGATGRTRYIQTVNRRVGIYNRAGALLSSNTLQGLAGFTANSFDPQIIWDAHTNRFYYTMDSVVSSTDNRLAFGFSKTASPNSTSDFCQYFLFYGAKFPDYPKLGDNQFFILIGTNNFQPSYTGSDIIAFPKPPGIGGITSCPTFDALNNNRGRIFQNVRDSFGQLVFTPTPANSIDGGTFGYIIARNLSLPSTRIWDLPVNGPASPGIPSLLAPRVINVASYTAPPDAIQPSFSQKLDTLDGRLWQAVLARNPLRNSELSLWTQHTVASGSASQLSFYEIRPDVNPAILRRSGSIAQSGIFFFNGAISSDRRSNNTSTGGSFVIGYNVSSTSISPRIVAGSSVNGAGLSFVLVKNGAGPYRDFTCAGAGQTCRWGDYASATPDPLPPGGAFSAVGLTHQFSNGGAMPTTQGNWTTWIYHIRP